MRSSTSLTASLVRRSVMAITAVCAAPLAGLGPTEPSGPPGAALDVRDPLELPAAVFARVSPSVVGITVWTKVLAEGPGDAFGTGTIVHPSGIVLTSITVVPEAAKLIRVRLPGGTTTTAERVFSVPDKELVVIKLSRPASGGRLYPSLALGRSGRARVGQIAFALGNAYRSINEDDQISFTAGTVSGEYVLTETRDESRYKGPTLETSAAVADGMDGGPLVDSRGEVIGILSLNFSRNRWLGTAVPIDVLKPLLAEGLGWTSPALESGVHTGLEVLPASIVENAPGDDGRRAVVTAVEAGGPAGRAGVEVGDRIVSWNGEPVAGAKELQAKLAKAGPGTKAKLGIERSGARRELEVSFWGRF